MKTKGIKEVKEFLGMVTGIVGAILVASHFQYSKYGYIFFAVSAVFWMIVAVEKNMSSLFYLNLTFFVINTWGIFRWFKF